MSGVAHIAFPGGGIFLPVQSPYDRQTLVEYVAVRVRSKGQVQVTLDNRCWSVRLCNATAAVTCAGCGFCVDAACYSTASAEVAHCVRCAFGDNAEPVSRRHERRRRRN